MIRRLALLAALLATSCYDSNFKEPDASPTPDAATTTIAKLHSLYAGTTFAVKSNVVVQGQVISDDQAANFYRTLCIEADHAGLEIRIGVDQLHNDFPIGSTITLRLNGLAIGKSFGVLQVGRMPAAGSSYATDDLGSRAAMAAHLVRNGETLAPPTPTRYRLAELRPGYCGTLVCIESLHYAPEPLSEPTWSGYKCFEDAAGNTLYTYVRAYADFATADVPVEPVTLVGVLQYDATGAGRYILKLRDETDCRVD